MLSLQLKHDHHLQFRVQEFFYEYFNTPFTYAGFYS